MSLKRTFISIVLGAILTAISYLVSTIISNLLSLPGLRKLKRIRGEGADMLSSSLRSAPSLDDLSSNIEQLTDEIDELRAEVYHHLLGEGLSSSIALAMVKNRKRLMWDTDQWETLVSTTKKLIDQGYPDQGLILHLNLSEAVPSAKTLEMFNVLVKQKVEDLNIFKKVADYRPTEDQFEKALELNSVYKASWKDAFMAALQ